MDDDRYQQVLCVDPEPAQIEPDQHAEECIGSRDRVHQAKDHARNGQRDPCRRNRWQLRLEHIGNGSLEQAAKQKLFPDTGQRRQHRELPNTKTTEQRHDRFVDETGLPDLAEVLLKRK